MVDYTTLAGSQPLVNIQEIGNALVTRQYLQDQPMRQMQSAQELARQHFANRLLAIETADKEAAAKAELARREALLNMGAPEPQAAAGAQMAAPQPQNSFMGVPSAGGTPTPPGWRPPMALPPQAGPVVAPPSATPAPATRTPYSPEAWGRYAASMADQERMKEKIEIVKKVFELDPELAKSVWNSDPMLKRFGNATMTGGDTKEVKVGDKVIGYSVKTPDGKWHFKDAKDTMKPLSDIGKLEHDRDLKIDALVKEGKYKTREEAFEDTEVKAYQDEIKKKSQPTGAYPIGHVQQFQEGRNLVYKEYMGDGKWKVRPDLGGGPKDLPPQVADDFTKWTKEEKEWHFENFKNTGVKPDFGWGRDAGRSRAQFQKEYAAWNLGQGVTGAEAGAVSAEYKALAMSLRNQEKIRGMMGGFVRNMDKQVVRVDELFNKIVSRVGVRALDLPLREMKTRAIGSGNEAIIEAYLLEISNEIGKLSTGSAASIQELSIEAQKKWAKIHDPNLSPREIKKILTETRHMGKLRLDSSDEEIKSTQEKMKSTGKKPAKAEGGPTVVETRKAKDGRILEKLSDGTIREKK